MDAKTLIRPSEHSIDHKTFLAVEQRINTRRLREIRLEQQKNTVETTVLNKRFKE